MNNIKINIPEGMMIDLEKSDLKTGIIFFKEKNTNIFTEDITKENFFTKGLLERAEGSVHSLVDINGKFYSREDLKYRALWIHTGVEVITHNCTYGDTILEFRKKPAKKGSPL